MRRTRDEQGLRLLQKQGREEGGNLDRPKGGGWHLIVRAILLKRSYLQSAGLHSDVATSRIQVEVSMLKATALCVALRRVARQLFDLR